MGRPFCGGRLDHYAPQTTGTIRHWHWSGPTYFGGSLGNVAAVTLIEEAISASTAISSYLSGRQSVQFFWTATSGPGFNWNGPFWLQSNPFVDGKTAQSNQAIWSINIEW